MPTTPTSKKDLKHKLRWLFKIYDINGDGLVEKFELQNVIDSFYTLLGETEDKMTLKVQAVIHSNEIFEKLNIDKTMFITIESLVKIAALGYETFIICMSRKC